MDIIKYIFLGVIQGFTELLPISSSGHLILFKALFDTTIFNSLNFEIISNFGSFIAIFILFYKDIVKILKDFFQYIFKKNRDNTKNNYKYAINIIISTIPVGITGLLFKNKIESINNIYILGFTFLITSLLLFIIRNIKGDKKDIDITWKDALIIGIFQAISIIPGISRSGSVLAGCLLLKIDRNTSLKYTFMLYFPVSIAALAMGLKDIINTPNIDYYYLPYLFGLISSGIITYISYKWLVKIVQKGKLINFSIYCLLLALFIFIYFK